MNTNQFISLSAITQNLQNTHSSELIPNRWKQGEIVLLYAEKFISKIDSACDIINAVNQRDATREILYIDTENHASALVEQLAENTHLSVYRPTFDDDTLDCDYADLVISAIETAVKETQIRVFVVDSINRIAAASFGRNASPVHIMKKLVALQMRYGISLLVIAHTDSRSTREALLALSDRDYYAQLKPREVIAKQSPTTTVGCGRESARYHQQSNSQVPSSTKDIPSDSSHDTPSQAHTPQLTKVDDNLYIDFTDSNIPRAERRRALRAYRKLQSKELTQNP